MVEVFLLREKKREGRGFYRSEKMGLKKSEESGPQYFLDREGGFGNRI